MKLNTYNPVADLPCVKIYPSPPECRSLLGSFNSSSSGLASFNISMLIKLKETKSNRWHVELGFEKSIGKNDIKGEVLRIEAAEDSKPLHPRYIIGLRFIEPDTNSIQKFFF